MMMSDLARTLRAQNAANNDDDDNGPDEGLFGAGGLIDNQPDATRNDTETLHMERQYFGLAHDMNEVLISPIHDAAARGSLLRIVALCFLTRGSSDDNRFRSKDNIQELAKLIKADKSLLNLQDHAGNSPAHWSAGSGALRCLAHLLGTPPPPPYLSNVCLRLVAE